MHRRAREMHMQLRHTILAVAAISTGWADNSTTIDFPVSPLGSCSASVSTQATGITPGGEIVGHVFFGFPCSPGGGPFLGGFLLRNGTFTSFRLSPNDTFPWGINPNGAIVGSVTGFFCPGTTCGFLLQGGNTAPPIEAPNATQTVARGINPQGDIVGNDTVSGAQHGFLLVEGTFSAIDVPGGSNTSANGINPRRDIVGSFSANGRSHGFLLVNGAFTTIDVPGALNTSANGISFSKDIVGSFEDANGVMHGFLLSREKFTTIDPPGATSTQAFGMNPSGAIVGTFIDSAGTHGFLLGR